MKTKDQINPNIAHISLDNGAVYFQTLNEDGTDWNEEATKQEYDVFVAYLNSIENNVSNTTE